MNEARRKLIIVAVCGAALTSALVVVRWYQGKRQHQQAVVAVPVSSPPSRRPAQRLPIRSIFTEADKTKRRFPTEGENTRSCKWCGLRGHIGPRLPARVCLLEEGEMYGPGQHLRRRR